MEADTLCSSCTIGSCALYTLSESELKSMESRAHKTSFARNEIVRKQDTPLQSIIYLRKGFVKEFLANEHRSDQVIQLIKPRSYIGLQGVCTNSSSAFSYQAITDVEVCFIDKSTFSDLIRGNGSFAREILISMSQESTNNQKRFLNLNQTQIFGKVAGMLNYLREDVYESDVFNLELTRSELGQMVSSTRESVTRALRWFHKEKIIQMIQNRITILDGERLNEIARRG